MLTAPTAIAAEPLLSAEEEIELAGQIEAGLLAQEARSGGRSRLGGSDQELDLLAERGERARQRYIRANLRLVAKIARLAAARSRLPEGDLFQEGCLGLIAAVERFDHRRGYRFSTYATFWVRAYVGVATAGALGGLGLPASRASQLRQARGVEVQLAQTLGRLASTVEVAARLGRSEQWTAELLAHQPAQSIDVLDTEAFDVASGWAVVDSVSDGDQPGRELLQHLSTLERDVVSLRYGFRDGTAHPYAEIGRRLGISTSMARRVEQRALEALRAVCPSSAAVHL